MKMHTNESLMWSCLTHSFGEIRHETSIEFWGKVGQDSEFLGTDFNSLPPPKHWGDLMQNRQKTYRKKEKRIIFQTVTDK